VKFNAAVVVRAPLRVCPTNMNGAPAGPCILAMGNVFDAEQTRANFTLDGAYTEGRFSVFLDAGSVVSVADPNDEVHNVSWTISVLREDLVASLDTDACRPSHSDPVCQRCEAQPLRVVPTAIAVLHVLIQLLLARTGDRVSERRHISATPVHSARDVQRLLRHRHYRRSHAPACCRAADVVSRGGSRRAARAVG
jgi:hypothetical protein